MNHNGTNSRVTALLSYRQDQPRGNSRNTLQETKKHLRFVQSSCDNQRVAVERQCGLEISALKCDPAAMTFLSNIACSKNPCA
jgi:hypothetical protein